VAICIDALFITSLRRKSDTEAHRSLKAIFVPPNSGNVLPDRQVALA
jgi:hypothetical protein